MLHKEISCSWGVSKCSLFLRSVVEVEMGELGGDVADFEERFPNVDEEYRLLKLSRDVCLT